MRKPQGFLVQELTYSAPIVKRGGIMGLIRFMELMEKWAIA
jgi:hypothetical protein